MPDRWTAADLPDLHDRTVVVSGANSGIGLVTAREVARAGARVVLAVRDEGRGRAAAATIDGDSEVRRLDLADLASVRQFAETWTGDVHVLINNAGVMAVPRQRTADGFEMHIGTNHLGPFALTNLLLANIVDRVVTLSSGVHRMGRIALDDLNWERRRYSPWPAYAQSKLANLLFTLELDRRLTAAKSSVRAVAAHPGYAATNLQSHAGNPISLALDARKPTRCSRRATSTARCRRCSLRLKTCPATAMSGQAASKSCAATPPSSAEALRRRTARPPSRCGKHPRNSPQLPSRCVEPHRPCWRGARTRLNGTTDGSHVPQQSTARG